MKAMCAHAEKYYSLFGNIPQYSALILCVTEQTTGGTERAIKEVNSSASILILHNKHMHKEMSLQKFFVSFFFFFLDEYVL